MLPRNGESSPLDEVDGDDSGYGHFHDEGNAPRTPGKSYTSAAVGARRFSVSRKVHQMKRSSSAPRSVSQAKDSFSIDEELPLNPGARKGYASTESSAAASFAEDSVSGKLLSTSDLAQLRRMVLGKPLNALLVFMPIGAFAYVQGWGPGSVFWLNFFAMVPLASLLGDFTEELALHTGEIVGGLINATFGNAVEVVVAIQALKANQLRVVQASMLGSVLSNLLLVLGTCFVAGGLQRNADGSLKYAALRFNATSAVANMSLLLLSCMTMIMPTLGDFVDEGIKNVPLVISRIAAICLLVMYILLLFFQLATHRSLFESDEEDEEPEISAGAATVGLGLTTLLVSVFSEFLVSSIEGVTHEFGLTKTFVGIIILPIVGNAVEHVTAVTVAMKGKTDLSISIALGSASQVAIFVVPLAVLSGWAMGRAMTLRFPLFEIALYVLAILIVGQVVSKGHSNWLEGSMLMMTYVLIGVALVFPSKH